MSAGRKEGWQVLAAGTNATGQNSVVFCWRLFIRPQELEKCGFGERVSDFLWLRMMLRDAGAPLPFFMDPDGFPPTPHCFPSLRLKGNKLQVPPRLPSSFVELIVQHVPEVPIHCCALSCAESLPCGRMLGTSSRPADEPLNLLLTFSAHTMSGTAGGRRCS